LTKENLKATRNWWKALPCNRKIVIIKPCRSAGQDKRLTGRRGGESMSLAENLQFLRKQYNITQEQLAEQLEVSRQSVSKWESGQSFPEMEKLLQISSMFHCNMDSLLQGDVSRDFAQDVCGYDNAYNRFSRWITAGVALIISGVGISALLEGTGINEGMCGAIFFTFLIVAVLIMVVTGMQYGHFKEKNPHLEDFYTEEEKEQAYRKFTVRIAVGVGIILVSLLFVIVTDERPVSEMVGTGAVIGTEEGPESGMTDTAVAERLEDLTGGIFLLAVAVAVSFLTYGGMQKAKYDIRQYNRDANPSPERKKRESLVGKICACIMMAATIVYLVLGFVNDLWERAWVVFAVGGILCGIAAVALSRDGEEA